MADRFTREAVERLKAHARNPNVRTNVVLIDEIIDNLAEAYERIDALEMQNADLSARLAQVEYGLLRGGSGLP